MPHAYLKCTCHDLTDLKALDFASSASSVDAPQSSMVTYPLTVILNTAFSYGYIEWASAQVPPTPLYLGGTVEREREREREREEERERWMDG